MVSVVVAGLLLGHKAPILQTAQSRIAERMNWRTIAFFLENTVFMLIGLQADWILSDVSHSSVAASRIVLVCGLTLVAVIVLRLVWVFSARYALIRPGADPDLGKAPPAAFTFLLGWAGMRGVVTLAAAFIIPADTPDREVLLLIAFTVVAGTLFIQGLSLPWLARRLHVPSPDPLEDALARATVLQQASKAGFKRLHELEYDDPHEILDVLKQRIEQRNFAAWERLGTTADQESPSDLYARVRLEMIEAERGRVLEIRSSGTVASEVISDVLSMLDVEESMLDVSQQSREEIRNVTAVRRTGDTLRPPRRHPRRRDRRRARVRGLPARGHELGRAPAVPRRAATSAAATPHRAGMRPPTSTTPPTRSWSPPSPARTGAGATSTTSPPDPWSRARGPLLRTGRSTRRVDLPSSTVVGWLACGSRSSGTPASGWSTTARSSWSTPGCSPTRRPSTARTPW